MAGTLCLIVLVLLGKTITLIQLIQLQPDLQGFPAACQKKLRAKYFCGPKLLPGQWGTLPKATRKPVLSSQDWKMQWVAALPLSDSVLQHQLMSYMTVNT